MNTPISTPKAPAAIGPYSQGMHTESMVYTSGQLGLDPASGDMPDDISAQTHLALKNLRAVLESAGSSLSQVLKTTVFLTDMAVFPTVNEIYAQYFQQPYPARSCIAVRALPKNGKVEIEAIATR